VYNARATTSPPLNPFTSFFHKIKSNTPLLRPTSDVLHRVLYSFRALYDIDDGRDSYSNGLFAVAIDRDGRARAGSVVPSVIYNNDRNTRNYNTNGIFVRPTPPAICGQSVKVTDTAYHVRILKNYVHFVHLCARAEKSALTSRGRGCRRCSRSELYIFQADRGSCTHNM
jgi:hypothetical protein